MLYDAEVIEQVRRELESGLSSADVISIRLSQPVTVIEGIIAELKASNAEVRSNADILRDNLQTLQGLLETAEWSYRGEPTVDNASALTGLVQTSIQTIKEIEARKDPAVLMNEILAQLIQPLFRNVVKYLTTEASKARGRLNERIPREHHAAADEILKKLVKATGVTLSADYQKHVHVLANILECKAEDQKVQMLRPVAVKDPKDDKKEA